MSNCPRALLPSLLLGAGFVLAACAGCGSSGRAVPPLAGGYKEPPKSADDVATLKSSNGLYIEGVDGKRVGSSNFRIATFGGNSVVVKSGKRCLRVMRETGESWKPP